MQRTKPYQYHKTELDGPTAAHSTASKTSSTSSEADEAKQQPLELEHVIGFSGQYLSCVYAHPTRSKIVVHAIGAVVCISDVTDPHRQQFLRGHDAAVSALHVSPNGKLLASGQLASQSSKMRNAPVLIWHFTSGKILLKLAGLTGRVTACAFSPNSRLLAAAGENCVMLVWDLETGDVLHKEKTSKPVMALTWNTNVTASALSSSSAMRHPPYQFASSVPGQMRLHNMRFEAKTMRYVVDTQLCKMPGRGLMRDYLAVAFHSSGRYLFAGTTAGEVATFSVDSAMYRSAVPVGGRGVSALCMLGDHELVACAGDGVLCSFAVTSQIELLKTRQLQLRGGATSLSVSSDRALVVCGTTAGKLYFVNPSDEPAKGSLASSSSSSSYSAGASSNPSVHHKPKQSQVNMKAFKIVDMHSAHTASISAVAFGKRLDTFVTVDRVGALFVWDIADYVILARTYDKTASATCVIMLDDDTIVSGWTDGSVRAHSVRDCSQLWTIANAHRRSVTCLTKTDMYIASGGEDGALRLWGIESHQFLAQFAAHKGRVAGIVHDAEREEWVHTCGADGVVATFDLRKECKVTSHALSRGVFTCMDQRLDHENELITGTNHGEYLHWDVDVAQPVLRALDPSRLRVSAVAVSPDGAYTATAGDDQQVKVYRTKDFRLVATCLGHSNAVTDVKWSPDGKQLVSTGADNAICVWNFYL